MTSSPDNQHVFGMIGLGTMGRNLLLNMADHGFKVTGYDKSMEQVALLEEEGKPTGTFAFSDIKSFVKSLAKPRAIMMLVPAGKIVDSVIQELIPLLDEGDLIIDGGNSHFSDTERRALQLKSNNLHFFGMGISGGEKGARYGPSMMPGGDKQAYAVMKPVLDAIAAKVNGEPCVTYIGPGASGHFVKMVHNGIEYAIMQLLAEAYSFMKNGLSMNNQEIGDTFEQWNNGRLFSYLLEITKDIFKFKEEGSSEYLIDLIKDEARSKGTGKWTSQAAMDIQAPITIVDTAVTMRDLSKHKHLRVKASEIYESSTSLKGNKTHLLEDLEQAMYFAMITTYSQGMHLLYLSSKELNYELELAEIAKIWRGGCIIRAAFLEDIYQAYHQDKDLEHLLLDQDISNLVKDSLKGSRSVLAEAIKNGIGLPAFAAALSYFDTFKCAKMPSNLIQAQRDFFGAHTYERSDKEGLFHTEWIFEKP